MALYLFATFVAFLVNFLLIVPYINLLYRMKLQRRDQQTKDAFDKPTPIFDKLHNHKQGTPVGGGILLVLTTIILYAIFLIVFLLIRKPFQANYPAFGSEIKIILFSFVGFAVLGLYDDFSKMFQWQKTQFFGLRLRHKLILEILLAAVAAYWLFAELKINIMYIPFFGVYDMQLWYIPFAAFIIVAFSNAINITDGLDGLASGVLLFALTAFWAIARSIIDMPTALFIAVWLGGLVAFLYFNIWPARIMLGDTGALSFGATFAVVGLVLGKAFALPIIGGVFVLEISTSLLQLLSKKFRKKKLFAVAPLHLYLQHKGWEEPKIVMRLWLIGILFAVLGLMIAFMK
ncbi:MAG: phospho-N-acetylmuramoyl-pentapeptide-transferase [Microgenomates group bacterium]